MTQVACIRPRDGSEHSGDATSQKGAVMKWFSRLVGVLCLSSLAVGLTAVMARGQGGTTSLRGTVTDPNGASVPDASVTLSDPSIGIALETKTAKDGSYQFLEVRPGTYTLTVSAPGFATLKQSGLVLLVATPATSNLVLKVASVATTVEVSAAVQAINTTDATIGNAFNQTQISALPFEGRDPTAILSLQPGVVTVADREPVNLNEDSRGGAVHGRRSDQADDSRARVLSLSQSDNNQLHGTAYEYTRQINLVANDYSNNLSELQHRQP